MRIFTLMALLAACFTSFGQVNPPISWQWQQVFANDTDVVAKYIKVDPAGDIYISGTFVDTLIVGNDTATAPNATGTFIVKMNGNGTPLWMKPGGGMPIFIGQNGNVYSGGIIRDPLTGAMVDIFDQGKSYTVDSNNDVISATWNEFDFITPIDAVITKYTGAGIAWQKTLRLDSQPSYGGAIPEIRTDQNDNIYFSGTAGDSLSVNNGQWVATPVMGSQRFFIARFAPNGDAVWVQVQTNVYSALSEGYGLDINNATGTVVTTGQLVGQMMIANDTIGLPGTNSIFVAAFDLNGTLTRSASYASLTSTACCNSGISIKALDNGGIYLQGVFRDTLIMGLDTLVEDTSNSFTGFIADDVFISKLDSSWNILSTYYIGNVGNIFEGDFDIMPDNSIVMAGFDIIPLRSLSGSPLLRRGFAAREGVPVVTAVDPIVENIDALSLYPNPSSDRITIRAGEAALYTIYNSQGSIVMKGKLAAGETSLDVSRYAQGVYHLQMAGGRSMRFIIAR